MAPVVIGTANTAKAQQCITALASQGIHAIGVNDVIDDLPAVEEIGPGAVDNAVAKAVAYSRLVGGPVLSVDYGLVLDGLPADRQPGLNVRRLPGHVGRADDEALIEYYGTLIAGLGGRTTGRWLVGAAVAAEGTVARTGQFELTRQFVTPPCAERVPGHPLASLQVVPSGRYVAQLTNEEEQLLWRDQLGPPLAALLESRG